MIAVSILLAAISLAPAPAEAAPDDYDAIRELINRSTSLLFHEKADLLHAVGEAKLYELEAGDVFVIVVRGIEPVNGMPADDLADVIRSIAQARRRGLPVKRLIAKAQEALGKKPKQVRRDRILPRIQDLAADLAWAVTVAGAQPVNQAANPADRAIFYDNVVECVWRHRLYYEAYPTAKWREATRSSLQAVFDEATRTGLWTNELTTIGYATIVLAEVTELRPRSEFFAPERALALVKSALPHGIHELEVLSELRRWRPKDADEQSYYQLVEKIGTDLLPSAAMRELQGYSEPLAVPAPMIGIGVTGERDSPVVPSTPMPGAGPDAPGNDGATGADGAMGGDPGVAPAGPGADGTPDSGTDPGAGGTDLPPPPVGDG